MILNEDRIKLSELEKMLDSAEIPHEIITHEVLIVTAEEGVAHGVGHLSEMAPALILKSEHGCLAAIIPGDRRLSYKKIKKELGLKNVSMANRELVLQVTGSEIGSVSLINPALSTIIDEHLCAMAFIYGGCGIPCHTLKINPNDLIRITNARVFDFSEPKQ